ncbi:MAG: hypothetical protein ACI9Y1_003597, partial [Lentisphaeria bacterium]
ACIARFTYVNAWQHDLKEILKMSKRAIDS